MADTFLDRLVKERDDLQKSYEVILDGSVILDFNRKKEITEIEKKIKELEE